MKGRSVAIVCWCTLCICLLAGCAGNHSGGFELGNHPQLLIPDAKQPDVKDLAMDSARAKGWNIVKATDNRLVMQRPLDPSSPTALALGVTSSAMVPVVEITSAFVEQSGGVTVALGATLITQSPGEKAAKRVDYTENYRVALTQSLESLRAHWTTNRQRVTKAIPAPASNPEPPPRTATDNDAATDTNPPAQAWGQTVTEDTRTTRGTTPDTARSPAPAPSRVAAELGLATPTPAPVASPTPPAADRDQTAAPLPAGAQPKAAPPLAPTRSNASPGAIVGGSGALASRNAATDPIPEQLVTPTQPTPEPVAAKNNMLTLSPSTGTGVWAYYAEQYARLRGCNIADGGAQLIETRADGEVHKVSCLDAESYLLKCQNGVCRGLQ